jgi:hypothetical protein
MEDCVRRWSLVIPLLALFLIQYLEPRTTMAQGSQPIRVLFTDIENDYPNGLTFRIGVESDHSVIKATLYYRTQGSSSTSIQPIDVEPGTEVTATYTWDTSRITVAPSSPILYHWVLQDQADNRLVVPEQKVYYDDLRFSWQELSDPELIVRWYEGDDDFGRFVYETARQALNQMKEQSGQGLGFPVFVLLYANDADFGSWHSYVDEWVGGQAFPPLGVTAEIIPPHSDEAWIQDVIPHEIAHLFFHQAVHDGMASWPAWLDEGLAQYYEFGSPDPALERAAHAARRGTLLPLASLSGGFGRNPVQVRLSYDQSLSAVTYLLETWDGEGLQGLILLFRQGKSPRAAIEQALGITWEEFEAGWITWMGVPTTPSTPPTPTATLVYPTPPSGWPTPTRRPTETVTHTPTLLPPTATSIPPSRTPRPTAIAASTPTPTLLPSPSSPTHTATPHPMPTQDSARGGTSRPSLCGAGLGSLFLPSLALLIQRRCSPAPTGGGKR